MTRRSQLPDRPGSEIGRLVINTSDVAGSRGTAGLVVAWPAFVLAFILGLNRGLVGVFGFDVVALVFGVMTPAARAVYVLLGVSAIYCAVAVVLFAKRRARKVVSTQSGTIVR
jgi:uncharacterized membrane protein YuzA (DUF378 family)